MQIKERGIENNAVSESKVRLRNNQNLRGRNAADTSDIGILKVNTSNLVEFVTKPQSSFTPSVSQDLATVQWVQDFVSGVTSLKEAVDCATTADIVLAPAPAVIDGFTLLSGNRVLVKNQAIGTENGIYSFDGTNLVRSADFDGSPAGEVYQGVSVDVIEGSLNGRKRFILTNEAPVIGTTALTFVEIPTGAIVPVQQEEVLTISATDVTNQYVELAKTVLHASTQVYFSGVKQTNAVDYNHTNSGGKTRIGFLGDLATGGAIALIAGDKLTVCYEAE